ncbi:hypothetical protein [Micromonospora zamorensis]|uniref:hypothetical protein n=1 Tax=Micromonospora zamorensis TaxID=709883 RepID=UPI00081FDD40|nr:hypothetical protein [Micromonospora zamorensis]WTE85402.1 hypothetical protein OHA01_22835 [Micromonospora zamorensis]SCG68946.1 hypothetical protein GA0070619_5848 [Micromonospora zamorensis]
MVDSQSTPARQRPSIVSISSYLLFLFLACQVISLIITLSTIGKTRDALRDAYAGSNVENADQVGDVFYAIGLGSAILVLLLAVVLGVLALFNNQGRNGARITTWIVGGIMVCCVGGGLLSNAAGGFTAGGETGANGPSSEEVQRRLEEALPSWATAVSLLLGVISLISLLAALILLAMPKANAFFRKPTAAWEPPTPGASYQAPGQPGYPQAPGQPGYPQSSGEPGYPQSSGEPSYPPPPGTNRPDDTPPADRPGSTPPSTS